MENEKILEGLGLSKQEAEAYLALLKLGGSLASLVAKEMSIKRTTVYAILKSLSDKGLALVYFRKGKKYYYAVQPHKLSSIFERKLEAFNSLIPTLQSMEKKQAQNMGIRFIETKEELKKYYTDTLYEYKNSKNKEYYAIGNDVTWENIDREFFRNYRKTRSKFGIKAKLLLSHDSKDLARSLSSDDPLREFKFFPAKYAFTSAIDIHKNRVTIVNTQMSHMAAIIETQPVIDTFRTIFEIFWDMLPEEKRPRKPKHKKL